MQDGQIKELKMVAVLALIATAVLMVLTGEATPFVLVSLLMLPIIFAKREFWKGISD